MAATADNEAGCAPGEADGARLAQVVNARLEVVRWLAGTSIMQDVMRALRVSRLLGCWVALTSCSSDDSGTNDIPLQREERQEVTVSADEGGVVECPGGARLEIPPSALAADTTITMTPLSVPSDADADAFAGVELLPHGLVFSEPAWLALPLSRSLPPNLELQLAEAPSGGARFASLGSLFAVEADGRAAGGWIDEFSNKLVMKNCHAGTRDELLEVWDGVPGRELERVVEETGLSEKELTTCKLEVDPLAEILSAYFSRSHEFASDVPVSAEAVEAIRAALDKGLQVVVLFGRSLEGTSERPTGVAHSAVVVEQDGELVIRSQLNVTGKETFAQLEAEGGSTTFDSPLEDIDRPGVGLRDMRSGEVMTNVLFGRDLANRDEIQRVWPHIAIYVENPRPNSPTDCEFVDITAVNSTLYDDSQITVTAEKGDTEVTLGFRTQGKQFRPGETITLNAYTLCLTVEGVCQEPETFCRVWGPETFTLDCDGLTWTVADQGQLSPVCEQ